MSAASGHPQASAHRSAQHEGTPVSHAVMHVAVGLGCDRGTPLTTLRQALAEALAQVGVRPSQVAAAASITLKADEPGLLALAREQGWRMAFYTPETLAAVAVPNPSETVRKYTGTPSVSEAAALMAGAALAGLAQALPMQALLVEKYKCRGADGRNATVSIARCDSFFLRFLLVFQP